MKCTRRKDLDDRIFHFYFAIQLVAIVNKRVREVSYGERNSAIKEGSAHIKGEKYIKEYRIPGSLVVIDLFRFPPLIAGFLASRTQIRQLSIRRADILQTSNNNNNNNNNPQKFRKIRINWRRIEKTK